MLWFNIDKLSPLSDILQVLITTLDSSTSVSATHAKTYPDLVGCQQSLPIRLLDGIGRPLAPEFLPESPWDEGCADSHA